MTTMNRRDLLQRGAQLSGGAVLGAAFLAACGSDKKTATTTAPTTASTSAATEASTADTTAATTAGSTAGTTAGTTAASTAGSTAASTAGSDTTVAIAPSDLGTLAFRLSWIKNSEFAGAYLADTNGYYTAAGFSTVNLIAGGPTATAAEVDVSSGTALVGISAPDVTAAAINAGGDLIIIGAEYQKNPFAVMSLASNPIKTPEDMYGKKFGLQSANQVVWDAFVAASGIDDSKIIKFPAQFDPQPLVNGECDCWFSFITNEPNLLKEQKVDTVTFLLADFGYPLVSETYVVKKDSITSNPEALKAFLKAQIQGWRDVYKDPANAAKLTTTKYGSDLGLDTDEQTLEVKSELGLVFTDDAKTGGILSVSDDLIAKNIETLGKAGLTITAEALFDFSLLKAVYAENPDLLGIPT
ncbi:MAG: transporter substrate-binding protein [Ilumatobacteraceae bacterium]|nr:transporter substrate-binding protein [Ilumatobacteraceae bacterium]